MKTIGLIGGMSWESTVTYYQLINEAVKAKLGGLHSAKILLYSVDFAQIEQYQASGAWDESAEVLTDAAKRLEAAGADFIVICTNTMHKVAPQIEPGDRASGCGGIMEPVAVWVRKGGEWAIIHRCRRCGALSSNRVAADDNPMKLMSIAMKPLCQPPFPLEHIEKMTALMGGDGQMSK